MKKKKIAAGIIAGLTSIALVSGGTQATQVSRNIAIEFKDGSN